MVESVSPDRLVERIVDYSRQLYAMADAGAWDKMPDLERERATLVKLCFESTPVVEDTDLATRSIKKILELDQTILKKTAVKRDEIGKGLDGLRKARSGARAYQAHSS